jgi:hypothetical protein
MEAVEYRGWILAPDKDAKELEALGVQLGEKENGGWNNCRVSSEALDAMDAHWGRWIWGLLAAGDANSQ